MADTNFHLLFRVGQIGHVQHGFGRHDNLGLLLALGLPNTLAKGQTMKVGGHQIQLFAVNIQHNTG